MHQPGGNGLSALLLLLISLTGALQIPAHAGGVGLRHTYDEAMKTFGKPTAQGVSSQCKNSYIAFYRRPDAMLKIAFDANGLVQAIGLTLTQKPKKNAATFKWPGLQTDFVRFTPYGARSAMAPWSYSWGAKQQLYWEVQKPATPGKETTLYIGSVVISSSTEFAAGKNFPYLEAKVGGNNRNGEFDFIRSGPLKSEARWERWRLETIPNSFILAASRPRQPNNEACHGFEQVQIDYTSPEKNLAGAPQFLNTGLRRRP